jgi:hypothetical protein
MEEAPVGVAGAAGTCCCWVWDAAAGDLARSKAGGRPFINMLPSPLARSLPLLAPPSPARRAPPTQSRLVLDAGKPRM